MSEEIKDQVVAKKYQHLKLGLSISETILSFILISIFIFAGFSIQLRDFVAAFHPNSYIQLLGFLLIVGLVFSVVSMPFNFISGFWIEHHFKLSNQTFLAWIWEQTKGFLVGLVLLLPIVLIFYYLLRNYPLSWWFWTATVLFFFSILIGKIAPQIIFPLFYKFEPISDDDLLERMQHLAKQGKFALQGIFRFNMSKNTKKANAAFTGLGKSKRIILGDNLLDEFSIDEIEAVFAHEVGHYVHKHLLKGIVRGTFANYVSLFAAGLLYQYLLYLMGFQGVADLAALPLLSLIMGLIGLITSPISNAVSRKYERQADAYALDHSENPQAFITSMQKLSKMNLADKEPHPWVEFLFHSHPSIKSRIRQAERFIEGSSSTL